MLRREVIFRVKNLGGRPIAPTEDSETYISTHVNPAPGSTLLGCIGIGVAAFSLERAGVRGEASQ